MALAIALQLTPRRTHSHPHSSSSSSSSGGGGGLSAGVIIGIIAGTLAAIFLVIFAIVYCNSYQNASRLREQKGTPVPRRKIFGRSLLLSVTLGLVLCCGAGCYCGSRNGDGGGEESGSERPQMEYTPIGDSAQTEVQCVADSNIAEPEGKRMGT